jgi:hypothetical protein
MARTPSGRFLVLTGTGLSLIVFALALLVHNHLLNKDLEQASRLMRDVRQVLDGAPARQVPRADSQDTDRFESVLMLMPETTPVDALPFYDEGERASFARSRWVGETPSDGSDASLRPPFGVDAFYEAGIVLLRWEADPATLVLEEALPMGQRLAWRIYRGLNLNEPKIMALIPFEQRRWRDSELPFSHSRIAYQVWCVVIDEQDALIAAEPSRLVSVELPERFEIDLIEGDEHSAVFRIRLGASTQPLGQAALRVTPGQTLALSELDTGLVLKSLQIRDDERLTTRSRLDFRADGSLVLDPATNTPRMSETQVLVSVRRLIATLSDPLGVPRTLELELP